MKSAEAELLENLTKLEDLSLQITHEMNEADEEVIKQEVADRRSRLGSISKTLDNQIEALSADVEEVIMISIRLLNNYM